MSDRSADLAAGYDLPGIKKGMGRFERLLSLWVACAIVAGIALGQLAPGVPEALARFEYAQVSIQWPF